jgi:S-adenosylmethionine decarboxylase
LTKNGLLHYYFIFKGALSLLLFPLEGGRKLYALGTHLLVELKNCNPEILKDLNSVKTILVDAAKKANATIVDVTFHEFSPFGISGVVVIAESHLTIHTWPEYGFAAVDVFTCGETIQPEIAAQYIVEAFECKNPSIVEMKRGIISHKNEKLPHKVCHDEFQMVF